MCVIKTIVVQGWLVIDKARESWMACLLEHGRKVDVCDDNCSAKLVCWLGNTRRIDSAECPVWWYRTSKLICETGFYVEAKTEKAGLSLENRMACMVGQSRKVNVCDEKCKAGLWAMPEKELIVLDGLFDGTGPQSLYVKLVFVLR